MNAKVKGVGGAINLTENESSLQRWLICGPEIVRILDAFEGTFNIASNHNSTTLAQPSSTKF